MEPFFIHTNILPNSYIATQFCQAFNEAILKSFANSMSEMYEQLTDELLGEVVVAAFQAKMQVSLKFQKEGSAYVHISAPDGRGVELPITLEGCIAALQWIEG